VKHPVTLDGRPRQALADGKSNLDEVTPDGLVPG
jgi:hypothetical protein